jgi:hypothetical protein
VRNFSILIVGIVIGYGLSSYFNSSDLNSSFKIRTIETTNSHPVVVKETRYHSEETASEKPTVDIKVAPVVEEKPRESNQSPVMKKSRTLQTFSNLKMTPVIFHNISNAPFLPKNDTRILNLKGYYIGKANLFDSTRTGGDHNVNLEIKDDQTKLRLVDEYDNLNEIYSFTSDTGQVFKTFPGDNNYLIVSTPDETRYFLIDIRSLPEIRGMAFIQTKVNGDIELKKNK